MTLAAAFGFFAVLAIRGLLPAPGTRARALRAGVSAAGAGRLLVAVACAFLLLPVVVSRMNRGGSSRSRARR